MSSVSLSSADLEMALNNRQLVSEACDQALKAASVNDGDAIYTAIERLDGASIVALPVERLFEWMCEQGRFLSASLVLSKVRDVDRTHTTLLYESLKKHIETRGSLTATSAASESESSSSSSTTTSSDDDDSDDDDDLVVVNKNRNALKSSSVKTRAPTLDENDLQLMRDFIHHQYVVDYMIVYEHGLSVSAVQNAYLKYASTLGPSQRRLSKSKMVRCLTEVVREFGLAIPANVTMQRRLMLRVRSASDDDDDDDDDDEDASSSSSASKHSSGVKIIREAPMEKPFQEDMSEAEMMRRDTDDWEYDDFLRPNDEIVFQDDADSEDIDAAVGSSVQFASSKKKRRRLRKRSAFIDDEAAEDSDDE